MEISEDILLVEIRRKTYIGKIIQDSYNYKKFKDCITEKEIDLSSGIKIKINFREEYKLYEISKILKEFPQYSIIL